MDLSGAVFRNVNLQGARVMEAMLVNARFSGLIHGQVVNDIEIAPLINAEIIHRYPERARLTPNDAAGVRDAWSLLESLSGPRPSSERASALPESTLRTHVDGEWSFLETLRHLIFVTDSWITGAVLGRTNQFHAFGMPPSLITDSESYGIDVSADPGLAEVIVAREERMDVVRALVRGLTDDCLRRRCGDQTVLSCLHTLFDEEWHHNWFANRDLDVLGRT